MNEYTYEDMRTLVENEKPGMENEEREKLISELWERFQAGEDSAERLLLKYTAR